MTEYHILTQEEWRLAKRPPPDTSPRRHRTRKTPAPGWVSGLTENSYARGDPRYPQWSHLETYLHHFMWSLILDSIGKPVLGRPTVAWHREVLRENFAHIPAEYRRRLAKSLLKSDDAEFLASVTQEERREAMRWRLYESDWADGRRSPE